MDALPAVAGFIAVAVITPGPNNFIVMAAAARGGFVAAVPAIAGVVAGSLVLLALAWAGADAAFEAAPPLRPALKLAGAAYLAWLGALLIHRSRSRSRDDLESGAGHLPSMALGVAGFQLLNPKSWVLILTAAAALSGEAEPLPAFAALAATLAALSLLCLTLWASAGAAIAGWLRRPTARAWFEGAMGGLLIGSAVWLLV